MRTVNENIFEGIVAARTSTYICMKTQQHLRLYTGSDTLEEESIN